MSSWIGELRVLSTPGEQKIQPQLRPEKLLYSPICGLPPLRKVHSGERGVHDCYLS